MRPRPAHPEEKVGDCAEAQADDAPRRKVRYEGVAVHGRRHSKGGQWRGGGNAGGVGGDGGDAGGAGGDGGDGGGIALKQMMKPP